MEVLLEILLSVILEPIVTLILGAPIESAENVLRKPETSKAKKVFLIIAIILAMSVFLLVVFGIIIGAIMLANGEDEEERNAGLVILVASLIVVAVYTVIVVIRLNIKKRRKKHNVKPLSNVRPDRTALRRIVHVIVDRPLGSVHPEHEDIVYGVNYGFVPDAFGGDGEAQDAYILGVDEPITEFNGMVVAIIHRLNDNEDKWVVAPDGYDPTDDEIISKTGFQEKYFQTEIIRH